MKKAIIAIMLCLACLTGAAEKHPDISTTIDFLDYVFFDAPENSEIYPLERYEQRIREIAECGVKKIYLRVNCLGLTLYPTKVARFYGEGYSYHWNFPTQAKRLAKTVRTYDVCKETIRIGHKYNLQVWAWDSVFEGGTNIVPAGPNDGEAVKATHNLPLSETFYIDHPEYEVARNPQLIRNEAELQEINRLANAYPIARIVCTETNKRPPLRITADNLVLYVSDDNMTYRKYDRPYSFNGSVTADGFNRITLDGLNITEKYVKFGHTTPFPRDGQFTMALRKEGDNMQVYNTNGDLIAACWRGNSTGPDGEKGQLNMVSSGDCAFDHLDYEVGFMRGVETDASNRLVYGVHEYCEPAVTEHQLQRFAEVAKYEFDGFMLNFRTHSREFKQEEFGYNAAVRKIYLEKHGVDIWKQKADLGKLLMIRADAVAKFFAACRKYTTGRPMYLTGLPPAPLGSRPKHRNFMCKKQDMLPGLYHRYVAEDKSADGIMMTGGYFPEHFTDKVTGGRDIKLGFFIEGADVRRNTDAGIYDFEADMRKLYNDSNLDEIEFYEMLELTNSAKFREVIRKLTSPK